MSGNTLYAFSEEHLERIFGRLLRKFNKTTLQSLPLKEIPEEDRLSQRQAAKMLNRSVQTQRKWKTKKKNPYYQIQGTIFYSKSELLAYAKNHPKDFNRL
jgi:DNA-binding transcriptional regulator YiaG